MCKKCESNLNKWFLHFYYHILHRVSYGYHINSSHIAHLWRPTPPWVLPELSYGAQVETVRQSYSAPSPPSLLLVWQTVFFSEIPWLFSLACPASIFLRVSRTEMDPWITKVLFLASFWYAAWFSSSHEQQLDWQICEYAVSGTVDKRFYCNTNASWLYP